MTRSRVLTIQHQEDCPPAWFGTWLGGIGTTLDVRRPYAGDELPVDLGEHHGLLILGGSMGAQDDARVPWLAELKTLVRKAVRRTVPVLGICLGHQLMTVALGGEVGVNPSGPQRGLTPISWNDDAVSDALFGTRPTTALHWNDDVATRLPDGARVLARAGSGEIEAVRFAKRAWGIQSHPEIDAAVLAAWIAAEPGADDPATAAELVEVCARARAAEATLQAEWAPVATTFGHLCSG